jgi:putative component of toxin-antitoxin plasmid stabilization module
MKKRNLFPLMLVVTFAMSALAGVTVTAPANNSTVSPTVQYIATATTSCSKGVSAIGIYTAPGQRVYSVSGAKLNTLLTLNPGIYNTVVQAWDHCGGSSTAPIKITVGGSTQRGVHISAPANLSNVSSPVNFVASATTSCSKGVSGMGIYTGPGQLAYHARGSSLNTSLSLAAGTYSITVQEWDHCGGTSKAPLTITVGSGRPGSNTIADLHLKGGWQGYALLPTSYAICASCNPNGPQATWSRFTGVSSPSVSGNSAKHNIGGQTQYADILWNNHLIGDFSSQGIHDYNHAIIPNVHNFVYDVYFFGDNLPLSQALEFDINQFFGGQGFIWGHECRIAGGHEWDIWDNVKQHWIPTGIACNPINNAWNHLIIKVQRTSSNQLLFQSITLNGSTATLNHLENPGNGHNWYGITVNYQQDGNVRQQPYAIWLDRFNFTYR